MPRQKIWLLWYSSASCELPVARDKNQQLERFPRPSRNRSFQHVPQYGQIRETYVYLIKWKNYQNISAIGMARWLHQDMLQSYEIPESGRCATVFSLKLPAAMNFKQLQLISWYLDDFCGSCFFAIVSCLLFTFWNMDIKHIGRKCPCRSLSIQEVFQIHLQCDITVNDDHHSPVDHRENAGTHYIRCIWRWLLRGPHPKSFPTIFPMSGGQCNVAEVGKWTWRMSVAFVSVGCGISYYDLKPTRVHNAMESLY